MLNRNVDSKKKLSWVEQSSIIFVWVLSIGVLLFSLSNLLVYFFVPTDGGTIWVRQGPIRLLSIVSTNPAELQEGDIILAAQGRDLNWWLAQKWRSWPSIIQRRVDSLPTTEITISRNQERQTLLVPLTRPLSGPLHTPFVTHMLVGFAYLTVGLLILKARSWDPIARLAVLIMVLLALIEQTNILTLLGVEWGLSTLWLFIPLRLLTRWFAYSAVLHFCLIFPTPKSWLQRLPHLPWALHLLNPVVTLAVMFSASGNLHARHSVAYPWNKNIYLIYLLLASALLVHAYLTERTPLAKTQMRWLAWGTVIAIVPNILFSDFPILLVGYSLIPSEVSSLLLLVVPIVVLVAIRRYRLWDIDLVVRASLIYVALSIALGTIYLVLVTIFIAFVGGAGTNGNAANNPAIYFFSALVVVFLFNPARQYFQRFIDRLFYRDSLNYNRMLNTLSRRLSTSLLFHDLLSLLDETVPEQLQLQGAQVMFGTLPPPDTPEYQTLKKGDLVWLYRLHGEAISRPPPLSDLQANGLWACAPILSGKELLGVYGLGRKKSGKFYNANDIDLIETLARQAGVAFQNAQLHAELADQARLERDLEIAQQIQLSLLPAKDPTPSGLDIVGFSIPAQSVGGDFYHYFDYRDEQVGVAVGDVSGKGVSAALLMAVSISTLRAQAPHPFRNTAHLLSEMNELLQSQTRMSDVNVAMLYATIENGGNGAGKFNVSNAGLVSPLLLRPGQPCEFLDACGLPMGIIEDPLYYECSFTLLPGDLIVLLSDGIVETMNEKHEMFGFERLEAVVNNTPAQTSAAEFIDRLKQAVHAFAGTTPQHDDMTVVAIRVT